MISKLTDILNTLDISKVQFIYTALFKGFGDLAKLFVQAFTKLLKKANQATLQTYSVLAANIAKFIRYGVELFVKKDTYKAALISTAEAIEALATHIQDGEYTEDELDADIDNIEKTIDAWKNVK